MLGFLQICNAIFLLPPADIFNDIAFKKPNVVGVNVFGWLNDKVLVMVATDLNAQRIKLIHGLVVADKFFHDFPNLMFDTIDALIL